MLCTCSEPCLRLWCTRSLIDRSSLRKHGLFPFAIQADTLVTDITQFVEDAALLHQVGAIDVVQGLLQPFTAIAHNGLQSCFQFHSALPQALHQSFPGGLLFLLSNLQL